MTIQRIAVIGAGQMGNGIAQVAACSGYDVVMIDIKEEFVANGITTIEKSLAKLVSIKAGHKTFTRTFLGANSTAKALVKPITPAFEEI